MLIPPQVYPLTSTEAHLAALGLTLGYVGSIYLSNYIPFSSSPPNQSISKTNPDDHLSGPEPYSDGLDGSSTILEKETPSTSAPFDLTPKPKPKAKSKQIPNRNDPSVMVRRIGAVTIATVGGLAGVRVLVGKVFGLGGGRAAKVSNVEWSEKSLRDVPCHLEVAGVSVLDFFLRAASHDCVRYSLVTEILPVIDYSFSPRYTS